MNINEMNFPEAGQWELELLPNDITHVYVDSLKIRVNSGTFLLQNVTQTNGYWVVANEDQDPHVYINIQSDSIVVYTYYRYVGEDEDYGFESTSTLVIGNMATSYLKNIQYSQSVARFSFAGPFFKTNNPSIGYNNDFAGATGKIYGTFYTPYGDVMPNKSFSIDEGYSGNILNQMGMPTRISIDDEGLYCAEITSRSYHITSLPIKTEGEDEEIMLFEPVSFNINEGDSININFNRMFPLSVPGQQEPDELFTAYPVPAKGYTNFVVDFREGMRVTVYNIRGQKVDHFALISGNSRYDCGHLPGGTYICTLSLGNNILSSKKIHVVK